MNRAWHRRARTYVIALFTSLSTGIIGCQPSTAPDMTTPRASPLDSSRPFPFSQSSSNASATAQPKIRYGYIDKTGKFVIPPHFLEVKDFKNGFASVRTSEAGADKSPSDPYYDAYIDKSGKPLYKPGLYRASGTCSTDGLCPVARYEFDHREKKIRPETYQAGYVDTTGKLAISLQHYESANTFSEGLALVKTPSDGFGWFLPRSKYGFLNKAGKFAISPQFDQANDFHEGLARVGVTKTEPDPKQPQKTRTVTYYGYIDKIGKFIAPPKFLSAAPQFSEGMAWFGIRSLNQKIQWGYINQNGQITIQPRFGIDSNGIPEDEVLKKDYRPIANFHEGLAATPSGFINRQGQLSIPYKLQSHTNFLGGRAAVRDNKTGNWGLFDRQGKWVISPKFVDLSLFDDRSHFAQINDSKKTLVILNRNGQTIPVNGAVEVRTNFQEGFSIIMAGGSTYEYFYINSQGKKVFSFPYLGDFHGFSEGLAGVAVA
jgi:hypothetical protein